MKAVNLIPASERQQSGGLPNHSNGVAYVLLGGLVLVGGLGAAYGLAERELHEKEKEAAQLEAQAQQVRAKASGLAAYKSFIALRQQREETILQLINSRFNWAHLLAELGADLPSGATVTSFSGTIGGPGGTSTATAKTAAPSSSTPPGSLPTVSLSGCAPARHGLPQVLSRLRLIEGVKTVELKSGTVNQTSAGSGSTGCAGGEMSFSISITFNVLPSPPTTAKQVLVPGPRVSVQPTAATAKKAGAKRAPVSLSKTAKEVRR